MTLLIYNKFLFPWKVPSLNELNFMRGIGSKNQKNPWLLTAEHKNKKSPYKFNAYNQVKQEWSTKVYKHVKRVGYNTVEVCFFHYLVVEPNLKRDPSNICSSAVKFIEDALQKAEVIPNDGWDNVLGINSYWILDRESKGAVFLLMANEPLSKNAVVSYYNDWKLNANDSQQVDNQG